MHAYPLFLYRIAKKKKIMYEKNIVTTYCKSCLYSVNIQYFWVGISIYYIIVAIMEVFQNILIPITIFISVPISNELIL